MAASPRSPISRAGAAEPGSLDRRPVSRRDDAQSRRFAYLLAIVVVSMAVQGTVAPGGVQQVVVSGLLGAALLLAFAIARVTAPLMTLAVVMAAVGLGVSILRALTGVVGDGEARVMNALLVVLGPPTVGLGVVRNLRGSREVRLEAVMGVLALYMLLGMLFAFSYGAIDSFGGHPFFSEDVPATVARCMYFSFITLATVGYGDLTARTDLGHTLTVFEALIGQIYLVTVVSLIVSNLGRRERP
jgi:hypothetical protein